MLILTLKLIGLVPEEYPDTCECGFLFDATGKDGKYTSIVCSNPECPIHSQFTITEMLTKLGIKANLGEEKAGVIVDYLLQQKNFDYRCCMDLIALPENILMCMPSSVVVPLVTLQRKVKELNDNGGITLPTYMSLWCFSNLGDTYCSRIFSTYSTVDEFYTDFFKAASQEVFISKFLNISESTATVTSITNILRKHYNEILRCADYFKFKTVAKTLLQICITGEVSRVRRPDGSMFKPRDTFATYLMDTYGVNVVLNKSYNSKVDFVVMDSLSNSRKAQMARKAQRKDPYALAAIQRGEDPGCRLITSDELVKIIEGGIFNDNNG